jgi:hypothetical protein
MRLAPPATLGVVSTTAIYSLDALKDRLGISDTWLRTARRRGLPVRYAGKRGFIIGSEFARYLEAQAEEAPDEQA